MICTPNSGWKTRPSVLEYRIDFGPGYRVYFGRDGDTIVILLTGGTK
jgi:putative addiction module killer protein